MFYVVAYDLPDTKRRNKLFKIMKGHGFHSQYSLFECELDDKELSALVKKIESIINKTEDDIKIYPLCKKCTDKIECYGKAFVNGEEQVIII